MDISRRPSAHGHLSPVPGIYNSIGLNRMFVILLLVSGLVSTSLAMNYTAEAEASFDALQTWYNTTSGLWDTCGW